VAVRHSLCFVFVFSKSKRRAFYGKWTESFYSYDASLYDDYVKKSSLSHVDQSALAASSEIHCQESLVGCNIVALCIRLCTHKYFAHMLTVQRRCDIVETV